MNKLFLMMMFGLTFVSCNQPEKPSMVSLNGQDNSSMSGMNEADRIMTQKIHQIIMSDDLLSMDAKNIKIAAQNGVIILHGSVSSSAAKAAIGKKITDIQGVMKVDNQLQVTQSSY